jgi:hypothetical protein
MASKTAKIVYRPVGIVSSVVGGLVAGAVFKQVWKHARDQDDAPTALQSEYGWGEILAAAAVQGVVFSVVKAAVERGGAIAFERWFGEWPGD